MTDERDRDPTTGETFTGAPAGKAERDRLLQQFVNHDSHSRPPNKAYDEGWERIFGKKDRQD